MSLDLIITEFQQRGVGRLRSDMEGLAQGADKAEGSVGNLVSRLGGMDAIGSKSLAAGAGLAGILGMIGGAALKGAGGVEAQTVTMEALTKSGSKAAEMMALFKTQAANSAFSRKELGEAGTLLAAYGMDVKRFLPLADDLGAAFKSQGASASDTARVFGRLGAGDFGEAFERLRDFGISKKALEGEGLKFDGNNSFQGTAEEALGAVEKLVSQKFSGLSKKIATETFEGAVSSFGDATEALANAAGKLALPEVTGWIRSTTAGLGELSKVAESNPGLVKAGATIAATGAAALIAGGAYLKVKSAVGGLGQIMDDVTGKTGKAAGSKKLLEIATLGDLKAESNKVGVAKSESGAIAEVGKSALLAAAAKGDLSAATDEAKSSLQDLAQNKVGELIDDPKGRLTAWRDHLKKLPGEAKTARDGLKALMAQPLKIGGAGFSQMSAFGAGGAPVGTGAALGSAALGAAAGYGVSDDLKSLGASDIEANLAGIGVGAAAAAAAMFIPGAAIPIAIATGFRYAFNELVNVPMERAAEAGTGADNAEVMGEEMQGRLTAAQKSGDREAIAEIYSEMSSKAALAGDETSAQSYAMTAAGQRKSAKKEGDATTSEFWDKQRKTQADFEARNPPGASAAQNGALPIEAKRGSDGSITFSMAPFTVPLAQAEKELRRMASDDVAAGYG